MSDPLSKAKALRQEEKARLKAFETPEEKRLRRLAKKEAKEKKRKQLMGWDEEYTNRDNPFGDSNLEASFVWKKKYQAMGVTDIDEKEIEQLNKKKLEETKRELEQVKKRRLEREKEREARLEEMNKIQREKEMTTFKEWEKQEDTFHLKQAKLRSKIRLRDGRAKPIDIVAKYIDAFGQKDPNAPPPTDEEKEDAVQYLMSAHIVEPYKCLNGLRRSDLEDLQEDIKVYMELDKNRNKSFWVDLQVIVEDELAKLKNYKSSKNERREGINKAVSSEVTAMFEGKSPSELTALKMSIEKKIASGEEGIDYSYWETLLSKLKAFIARARLREKHAEHMASRMDRLKSLGISATKSSEKSSTESKLEVNEVKPEPVDEPQPGSSKDDVEESKEEESEKEERLPYELILLKRCQEDYESGRYSPELVAPSNHEVTRSTIISPEDDEKSLNECRTRVLFPRSANAEILAPEISNFQKEAMRGMDKDEVQFSVEETIKQGKNVMSWADKYKPRKPRYFNRVHTGFEWNKYNQTHYDVDNPPPKIVQGYKFNLFYPDLIDKSSTPQYKITPCPENPDFAIIRFSAGPPYEDIAFKIVNREWNYSYKSGFRSQFNNNILQLWFHFKRYRYRR